jgi:predicted KAP-like P-loop ATPase
VEENLLSDKAVAKGKDDKFQRAKFSRRIAETIINRTSADSIVMGLYGAWGEGKTSVLNFIREELSEDKNIIHFTFNPWRFTDEAALLISFFNTLAGEIKGKVQDEVKLHGEVKEKSWWQRKKGENLLKTSSETIGDIIQDYGKLVSIFGAGELAEGIGKAISNVDVEELKARIEKLLRSSKKRIVIFIDDIDRLEKDEIHAIFRLVKLTGDFAYTTYVLSFDEHMVSAAIGARFGAGDQRAGFNFLEKIVQVPIKLPLIQKNALTNFTYLLIDQSLANAKIVLTNEQQLEFGESFSSNYLIRLTTPRLAIRYGNTVSFSLPLLKGEVNCVDLLLIEAVRVLYPEAYEFIRANPKYFINSTFANANIHDAQFKEEFESAIEKYSVYEKANVQGALQDLFPVLEKAWGNKRWASGQSKAYNEKRICNPQYFNRYFSYAVLEGEISDVEFDEILDGINESNFEERIDSVKNLLEVNASSFIEKIRNREKFFDERTALVLCKLIGLVSGKLSKTSNAIMPWGSPLDQAAIFISQLVRNQLAVDKKYQIIEWIVENNSIQFSYEVVKYCANDGEGKLNKLFTDIQYNSLIQLLIERAKYLSGDIPIWQKFNNQAGLVMRLWGDEIDRDGLNNYVLAQLELKPNSLGDLLKAFVGLIHSSSAPEPYYGEFRKDSFEFVKRLFDVKPIYKKAEDLLSVPLKNIDNFEDLGPKQTNENIIKQFAYWYNKDVPAAEAASQL